MAKFFSNNPYNSLDSNSLCRDMSALLPATIKTLEDTERLLESVINYCSSDNTPTLAT